MKLRPSRTLLLVVATTTLLSIASWLLLTQLKGKQIRQFSGVDVKLPDRLLLGRHIFAISGPLSPHTWRDKENLEDVAGYVADQWIRSDIVPQQQVFPTKEGEYKNVYANFGPDTEEVVVIGANYDSSPDNDNTSGVAAAIEIAKLLSREKLKRRVIVVTYALGATGQFSEENGFLAHARHMKKEGKKVQAMIFLDQLGIRLVDPGTEESKNPKEAIAPDTGNFVTVTSNQEFNSLSRKIKKSMREGSHLSVMSMNTEPLGKALPSSHQAYSAEGFPSVVISDTAFQRNKNFAVDPREIPERLDFNRLAFLVDGIFRAVVDLANAP